MPLPDLPARTRPLPHRALRLLAFLLPGLACGQTIIPPAPLLRDPAFAREFTGSYGILSDVEPKVSTEEQAVLASIRELFEQSKFAEAEATLTAFISETEKPTDPKRQPAEISPAMVFVLGNLNFQANRPEQARKAFLEAITKFPRFRRAHTNLGYLYISQNKTSEALPMLQRAIELGENAARAHGLLGYCHLLGKNAIAAETAYRQALLLDPASRDWQIGLAQALIAQEKHAEAASLIGTLIHANPNDKQLWLQQTSAFLALERKQDAIINLETLRLRGMADEANLTLLGNLHLDLGQPGLALNAYQAAIKASNSPDLDRSLKTVRILTDNGSPEEAASLLESIKSRMGKNIPDTTRTTILLAETRVARATGNHELTGNLLTELASIAPTHSEVLIERARHFEQSSTREANEDQRQKLIAEARTHYQLALRSETVAYQANLALGQLLVRERRYQEALGHLDAAQKLKPSESLEQYANRVRRAADRVRPPGSNPTASPGQR